MSIEYWVVVGVDPENHWWIEQETVIRFGDRDVILRPWSPGFWPDVSLLRLPNESYSTAATLINRFLSAMAWSSGKAFLSKATRVIAAALGWVAPP